MKLLCLKCKGRGFCGKSCKWNKTNFKNVEFKKEFQGTSPTIFIGRFDYPMVNVGIMSPQFQTNKAKTWDDPHLWSKKYSIPQVIDKRRTLVNSRTKNSIKKVNEGFVLKLQEIALSSKPLDIEVSLNKKPKPLIKYDFVSNPMGPSSKVEKLVVCDNAKIKKIMQKCYDDTDLKSMEAITRLYKKGFNENTLSRVLSSGALGVKKDRKLVPTRWSITAVDDGLGKQLIKSVKHFNIIDHYEILHGSFYGNIYTIILLPTVWGYELFETLNGKSFCHDVENYNGRKKYAQNTAGGYYASRLAVLEYLNKIKRQATAIVIRHVTNEYFCPLGVWVVRQATRKSTESIKLFNSKQEMISHLQLITPLHNLLYYSKLYESFNVQKRISAFL